MGFHCFIHRTKNYRIGYVPQHGGYFHDLTLRENLKAISEIVIENKKLRDEKINLLISKFELDNLKEIKAKHLSGGERKKLVIALSLLSNDDFAARISPGFGGFIRPMS